MSTSLSNLATLGLGALYGDRKISIALRAAGRTHPGRFTNHPRCGLSNRNALQTPTLTGLLAHVTWYSSMRMVMKSNACKFGRNPINRWMRAAGAEFVNNFRRRRELWFAPPRQPLKGSEIFRH